MTMTFHALLQAEIDDAFKNEEREEGECIDEDMLEYGTLLGINPPWVEQVKNIKIEGSIMLFLQLFSVTIAWK